LCWHCSVLLAQLGYLAFTQPGKMLLVVSATKHAHGCRPQKRKRRRGRQRAAAAAAAPAARARGGAAGDAAEAAGAGEGKLYCLRSRSNKAFGRHLCTLRQPGATSLWRGLPAWA
jgi:hypothetical protein